MNYLLSIPAFKEKKKNIMTILMCEEGGLMEDPNLHWEQIGEAEGSTTQEVADNLAKKDEGFAGNYDPESVTLWGWRLKILV